MYKMKLSFTTTESPAAGENAHTKNPDLTLVESLATNNAKFENTKMDLNGCKAMQVFSVKTEWNTGWKLDYLAQS